MKHDLKVDFIPKNYFCKFSHKVDQTKLWELIVYRYYSILNVEQIDLVLSSEFTEAKTYVDNDWLVKKSRIMDDDKGARANYTSMVKMPLPREVIEIDLYARNLVHVDKSTFKIVL